MRRHVAPSEQGDYCHIGEGNLMERGATPLGLLLDLRLEGLGESACGPILVFQQPGACILSELLPQFLQLLLPPTSSLIFSTTGAEVELVIALRMFLIPVGLPVLVSRPMACGFTLKEGVQPLPGRPP